MNLIVVSARQDNYHAMLKIIQILVGRAQEMLEDRAKRTFRESGADSLPLHLVLGELDNPETLHGKTKKLRGKSSELLCGR